MSGTNISYPNGTSVTIKGEDKIYTNTTKRDGAFEREMLIVSEKNKRISILKDVDNQGSKTYYKQDFSLLALEDGRPSSLTNCDIYVSRDKYSNSEYSESKFNSYVKDLIWGTAKEKIFGTCFTVTNSICESLKRDFNDPDFKKIKSNMNSCQKFADKFSKASTGDSYYRDEEAASANIEAMGDAWEKLNVNPKAEGKVKSEWIDFYNNLARGERENFSYSVKRYSKMLDMCERMEFAPKLPKKETGAETTRSTLK